LFYSKSVAWEEKSATIISMDIHRIQNINNNLGKVFYVTLIIVLVAFLLELIIPGDNFLFIFAMVAGPILFFSLFLLFIFWVWGMILRKSMTRKDKVIGAVVLLFFLLGLVF